MRKIIFIFSLIISCILTGETVFLDNSSPNEIFFIKESKADCLDIQFNLMSFESQTIEIDGEIYSSISHNNTLNSHDMKTSDLPIFSTFIAIPRGSSVSLEINNVKTENYISEFKILKSKDSLSSMMRDTCEGSSENIFIGKPVIIRDYEVVPLTIKPFQIVNSSGLNVMKRVDLTVKFDSVKQTYRKNNRKLSRSFMNFYNKSILNHSLIKQRDDEYQEKSILILYKSDLNIQDKLNEFVNWKKNKGFKVVVADQTHLGNTNVSAKNYIQNAYDTWENPPEYVIILGDTDGPIFLPTWFDGYGYAQGAGDYKYVQLEGNDILPDAFIGRISVRSATEFKTVINKIISYEKNNNLVNSDWFNHSVLVGDSSSSGISCVYVSEYIKEKMLEFNEDFIFRSYNELNGDLPWNVPNVINNAINEGSLFYSYRGYGGTSGWGSSDVNSLSNIGKPTNALLVTCGTNSFDGTETLAEALLRSGTPSTIKGGVSVVGMSTIATHTRFNNVINTSIMQGIYSLNMETMGEAINWARLNLYRLYNHNDSEAVNAFCQWVNLMGDPSMSVWRENPKYFDVSYQNTILSGTNSINVDVRDENNNPVENAFVTIRTSEENIFTSEYTNEEGNVLFFIDQENINDITLTVTKQDYTPFQDTVRVEGYKLGFIDSIIDDDNDGLSEGNSNEKLNPGETIEMKIIVKNFQQTISENVTGFLSTEDPYIMINSGNCSFNNINSNDLSESLENIIFEISNNAPHEHKPVFHLVLEDDNNTWQSNFELCIESSNLEIRNILVSDNSNDILDPGETAILKLDIINNGLLPANNIFATITCEWDNVLITDSESELGTIDIDETIISDANPFEISIDADLIPGMMIPLDVLFFNDNGYEEREMILLEVGSQGENDPTGPDEYGYFCYDDQDSGYELCPVYDWIEIAPESGGSGALLDVTDLGGSWEEGEMTYEHAVKTLDLPFTFRFYGCDYDRISISTNGFVTFAETENAAFRNSYIPGPMGPSPIIAAFWDDLCLSNNGRIYTFYDELNHIFIIEWYHVQSNSYNGNQETFQILLYDPLAYLNVGGNGKIKIQYKEFHNVNNSSDHSNYCTIGIENDNETIGLQYTFNNQYPSSAKEITNESAILFSTGKLLHDDAYLVVSDIYIHDNNGNNYINPGETINLGLSLTNFGILPANNTSVTVSSNDPMISLINTSSNYPTINSGSCETNYEFISFAVDANCNDGYEFILNINVQNESHEWEYNLDLTVHKPTLEIDNIRILDYNGNANCNADPGETVLIGLTLSNDSFGVLNNVNFELLSDNQHINVLTEQTNILKIPEKKIYQVVFEVEISEDAPENELAQMRLIYNSDETEDIEKDFHIIISSISYFWDFEDSDGGFVPYLGWELGQSNHGAYSGSSVWGTDLDSTYTPYSNWILESPEVLISDSSWLTFYHYCAFEENWDGGQVRISTNGGNSFELIYPEDGYSISDIPGLGGEPGFSYHSYGWDFESFDLSEYSGMDIIIQWRLGSDDIYHDDGWFIDDVSISTERALCAGFEGIISLDNDLGSVDETILTFDDLSVTPDINGNFRVLLPSGSSDLSVVKKGFSSYFDDNLNGSSGELVTIPEITLNYLNPPQNLNYSLNDNTIQLSWELSESNRKRDRNTIFYIYRRDNTAEFTKIDSTEDLNYSEALEDGIYNYYITAKYANGESFPSNNQEINLNVVDNYNPILEYENMLLGNYPNPFNPSTQINFSLAQDTHVELKIYNIKGQLVKELANRKLESGNHSILWNGKNQQNKGVASGVYFYKIKTKEFSDIRKALLIK